MNPIEMTDYCLHSNEGTENVITLINARYGGFAYKPLEGGMITEGEKGPTLIVFDPEVKKQYQIPIAENLKKQLQDKERPLFAVGVVQLDKEQRIVFGVGKNQMEASLNRLETVFKIFFDYTKIEFPMELEQVAKKVAKNEKTK